MAILRFFSDSKTVTELKVDCDNAGLQVQRSPLHFSISPTEFVQFTLPLATAAIGVLVAYIKRGKKIRIEYFENGHVKSIDTANATPEDITKALEALSQHRSTNED
ncbi:hypothetical protein [Serratia bockelmannii]|uniref:hypothetical protein n=1 Tax=Serratia bockelmannii TaxID=2703793 RepID=UPI003314E7AD